MIRRMDGRIASLEELREKGRLPRLACATPGCRNTVTRKGAICLPCALEDDAA
jgi:hypothetical protein